MFEDRGPGRHTGSIAAKKKRRRRKRPSQIRHASRLLAQLVVVIAGGMVAGGLLVLLAFPNALPIPWPGLLVGAVLALALTARLARRLQP